MQASEAMLREGQRVYVTMGIELYADLRALFPCLSVADDNLHRILDTDPAAVCQIEAYYVLGDVTAVESDAFSSNACIRVAFNSGGARPVIVNVALNRPTGNAAFDSVIALERSVAHGPLVRELAEKRRAMPVRRSSGTKLCWV